MSNVVHTIGKIQLLTENQNVVILKTFMPTSLVVFFKEMGLPEFKQEQHGNGPGHYACQVGDKVLEIYPT